MNKYFHLLSLSLLITYSNAFSIVSPIQEQSPYLVTEVCYGTPTQCFSTAISFSSCKSFISGNLNTPYKPTKSKTYKSSSDGEINISYDVLGKSITGQKAFDTLSISNRKIGSNQFYLATNTKDFQNVNGLLTLCPSNEGEQSNTPVISNITPHHVISVYYNEKIIYGALPTTVVKDYKSYGTCELLSNSLESLATPNQKWECFIEGVSYGTHSISSIDALPNTRIAFDNGYDLSLAPFDYLLHLEKNLFNSLIKENKCIFGIKNGLFTFSCGSDMYLDKNVNLVIGNWLIKLSSKDLFTYDENEDEFDFVFRSRIDNNQFVLGNNVLKKLITVYDASNNCVGFYNTQIVEYIGNSKLVAPKAFETPVDPSKVSSSGKAIIGFVKFVGFVLLCGLMLLLSFLVFRYFRRKRFPDQSHYYKVTDDLFESGTFMN